MCARSITPEIMANQVGMVGFVGKNLSVKLQTKTIARSSNPVYGWDNANRKTMMAAAGILLFKIKTTEPKNKK